VIKAAVSARESCSAVASADAVELLMPEADDVFGFLTAERADKGVALPPRTDLVRDTVLGDPVVVEAREGLRFILATLDAAVRTGVAVAGGFLVGVGVDMVV
jgi:hypothetical protein